jgi:hypothetical protein
LFFILLGLMGYGYGMFTGHASPTALIPAAFGVVFLVLGLLAAAKENLRKHLMHAAMALALIGFIMTAGRLLMNISTLQMSAAVLSQAAMSVVCLILVIAGIRSFAAARLSRQGEV